LLALFNVKLYLLVFFQVTVTGTLNSGEVCEDIGGAIIWSDEAVAFVGVEPFDCACGHNVIPFQSWTTRVILVPAKKFPTRKFVGQQYAQHYAADATWCGSGWSWGTNRSRRSVESGNVTQSS